MAKYIGRVFEDAKGAEVPVTEVPVPEVEVPVTEEPADDAEVPTEEPKGKNTKKK